MNSKEEGMILLEIMLAMSIFSATALALLCSMQGQLYALDKMRSETFALWSADNQLMALYPFSTEYNALPSEGSDSPAGLVLPWRMKHVMNTEQNIMEHIVEVALPSGQVIPISAWSLVPSEVADKHDGK